MVLFVFFFFKQKTAYEMRISDWSSDVCSSDLVGTGIRAMVHQCAVSARGAVTEAAALLTVAIVAARRADRGTKVIAALRAPPRDAVAIPLRPEERDRERLGEARVVDRALKEDFAGGIFGDGFPESTELDPAIDDVERADPIGRGPLVIALDRTKTEVRKSTRLNSSH